MFSVSLIVFPGDYNIFSDYVPLISVISLRKIRCSLVQMATHLSLEPNKNIASTFAE